MNAPGRVLVHGALGRMGLAVRDALADEKSLALGAALEAPGHPELGRELAPGVEMSLSALTALVRLQGDGFALIPWGTN